MLDRKNGFHPKTICSLLAFGFIGLFCCAVIERIFFGGDDTDMPASLFAIQMSFAFIWIVTETVILPAQILYFRRRQRLHAALHSQTTLPDLADKKVPTWISLPVLAFFWLFVFVLILLLMLLGLAVNVFIPQ